MLHLAEFASLLKSLLGWGQCGVAVLCPVVLSPMSPFAAEFFSDSKAAPAIKKRFRGENSCEMEDG